MNSDTDDFEPDEIDEDGARVTLSWTQLREQSLAFAQRLRELGVGE